MYLSWAQGLDAIGCNVIWMEAERFDPSLSEDEIGRAVAEIREFLISHGLRSPQVALASNTGAALPWDDSGHYLTLDEAAAQSDLFFNAAYHESPNVINRFRRSAFFDGDPGVMQLWLSRGDLVVAPHDIYFTVGETVGKPGCKIPDAGLEWHFMPPAVYLPSWPVVPAPVGGHYTTVSNWWSREWIEWDGKFLSNEKRTAFLEYIQVPKETSASLELSLTLGDSDHEDVARFEANCWNIRPIISKDWTPAAYHRYVQQSRGEFSCAKPFYVLLDTAWIADRTLHYMASGRPAVLQDTGPSSLLPGDEGVIRFRSPSEAAKALEAVEADYDRHSRRARQLVEEHFDATKLAKRMLERALS